MGQLVARWSRPTDVIPEHLQTFDLERWIQAAIDADDIFIRHIPVVERATHWYVARVTAPRYFRAALRDAVGARAADFHFYEVLDVPHQAARDFNSFEVN